MKSVSFLSSCNPNFCAFFRKKQFERLGSGRTYQANARIIAATNQDLWRMVQERKFRADLYYRLNVFPITLPPIRDRVEDIPALIEYFVQRFSREMGKRIETIPSEVMNVLKLYDWPGNIRELENVIKRAVIMTTGTALRPMLGELKRLPGQTSPAAKRTLAEAEKDHIVEVLRDARWVLGGGNGAAARLGMPRTSLVCGMRKLGIAREQGSKSFRGRLSELPDSPAESMSDRQELLNGTVAQKQSERCFRRWARLEAGPCGRRWVNWRWPACFSPVRGVAGVSEATSLSGWPRDGRLRGSARRHG